jgi:hypothetical protein
MQNEMLTPSSLARDIPQAGVPVLPAYDRAAQSRGGEAMSLGAYSGYSVQTFDTQGRPQDSQADNND